MNFRIRAAMSLISSVSALGGSSLASGIAISSQPPMAQAQLSKPSSGLINPRAIVFSPVTKKVYTVDTDHNAVQIYSDESKQAHRVPVGAAPVSIAVNAA